MAVIDASVYVTLLDESDPEQVICRAWFTAAVAADEPILAPSLILSEVAAALSRGRGDAGMAKEAARLLENSAVVQLAPLSLELASLAATIAAEQRVRGADAVYLALAQQLGDTLITLDRQQLQRGVAVVTTRRP
ncbi:MAG: type II toxin-antitoxin system VapC family toxin [Caldilineaceae bacterium]|jgi:predicted nucleic acid-binding protein|nr:type II toxin-antitoxin system VapC family toxin [Caldilineaceae bacterium]